MTNILSFEDVKVVEKLSFEIDGKWKVRDVIDLFTALQNLYDYYSCFIILSDPNNFFELKRTKYYEDRILCIGHINQNFVGKSTTIIDRDNKFYYFDKDPDPFSLNLNLIQPLFLKEFRYSSPGFNDVTGMGEAIGHLKELCFKIIDIFTTAKKRKNEDRKEKLKNDILEIERNKQFAKLLEEIGFENEDIRKIILNEYRNTLPIAKLILDEKIKSIQ